MGRPHPNGQGTLAAGGASGIPSYLYAVLALLVLRVLALVVLPLEPTGDAANYFRTGREIAETLRLPPVSTQSRGVSLLITPLMMLTHSDRAALVVLRIVNIAMDLAVIAALIVLAHRQLARWPSARTAWAVGLCLQPVIATMSFGPFTEPFAQMLVLFGVLMLLSRRTLISGVVGPLLLGMASLLRIDLLPLVACIVLLAIVLQWRAAAATPSRVVMQLAVVAVLPLAVLGWQYASTREASFAKPVFRNAGYMAWMRTWLAYEKTEHDAFAFSVGAERWPGFVLANYPACAFASDTEQKEVGQLLETWRAAGYSPAVDEGFSNLARRRTAQSPLRSYILIPAARMAHFWINKDGAQSWLRVVPIPPPFSTAAVGLNLAFKLAVLGLALAGGFVALAAVKDIAGSTWEDRFHLLALAVVVLRTLEMGALGVMAWAGLMEVRYVLVAVPFEFALAALGLKYVLSLGARRRAPAAHTV